MPFTFFALFLPAGNRLFFTFTKKPRWPLYTVHGPCAPTSVAVVFIFVAPAVIVPSLSLHSLYAVRKTSGSAYPHQLLFQLAQLFVWVSKFGAPTKFICLSTQCFILKLYYLVVGFSDVAFFLKVANCSRKWTVGNNCLLCRYKGQLVKGIYAGVVLQCQTISSSCWKPLHCVASPRPALKSMSAEGIIVLWPPQSLCPKLPKVEIPTFLIDEASHFFQTKT